MTINRSDLRVKVESFYKPDTPLESLGEHLSSSIEKIFYGFLNSLSLCKNHFKEKAIKAIRETNLERYRDLFRATLPDTAIVMLTPELWNDAQLSFIFRVFECEEGFKTDEISLMFQRTNLETCFGELKQAGSFKNAEAGNTLKKLHLLLMLATICRESRIDKDTFMRLVLVLAKEPNNLKSVDLNRLENLLRVLGNRFNKNFDNTGDAIEAYILLSSTSFNIPNLSVGNALALLMKSDYFPRILYVTKDLSTPEQVKRLTEMIEVQMRTESLAAAKPQALAAPLNRAETVQEVDQNLNQRSYQLFIEETVHAYGLPELRKRIESLIPPNMVTASRPYTEHPNYHHIKNSLPVLGRFLEIFNNLGLNERFKKLLQSEYKPHESLDIFVQKLSRHKTILDTFALNAEAEEYGRFNEREDFVAFAKTHNFSQENLERLKIEYNKYIFNKFIEDLSKLFKIPVKELVRFFRRDLIEGRNHIKSAHSDLYSLMLEVQRMRPILEEFDLQPWMEAHRVERSDIQSVDDISVKLRSFFVNWGKVATPLAEIKTRCLQCPAYGAMGVKDKVQKDLQRDFIKRRTGIDGALNEAKIFGVIEQVRENAKEALTQVAIIQAKWGKSSEIDHLIRDRFSKHNLFDRHQLQLLLEDIANFEERQKRCSIFEGFKSQLEAIGPTFFRLATDYMKTLRPMEQWHFLEAPFATKFQYLHKSIATHFGVDIQTVQHVLRGATADTVEDQLRDFSRFEVWRKSLAPKKSVAHCYPFLRSLGEHLPERVDIDHRVFISLLFHRYEELIDVLGKHDLDNQYEVAEEAFRLLIQDTANRKPPPRSLELLKTLRNQKDKIVAFKEYVFKAYVHNYFRKHITSSAPIRVDELQEFAYSMAHIFSSSDQFLTLSPLPQKRIVQILNTAIHCYREYAEEKIKNARVGFLPHHIVVQLREHFKNTEQTVDMGRISASVTQQVTPSEVVQIKRDIRKRAELKPEVQEIDLGKITNAITQNQCQLLCVLLFSPFAKLVNSEEQSELDKLRSRLEGQAEAMNTLISTSSVQTYLKMIPDFSKTIFTVEVGSIGKHGWDALFGLLEATLNRNVSAVEEGSEKEMTPLVKEVLDKFLELIKKHVFVREKVDLNETPEEKKLREEQEELAKKIQRVAWHGGWIRPILKFAYNSLPALLMIARWCKGPVLYLLKKALHLGFKLDQPVEIDLKAKVEEMQQQEALQKQREFIKSFLSPLLESLYDVPILGIEKILHNHPAKEYDDYLHYLIDTLSSNKVDDKTFKLRALKFFLAFVKDVRKDTLIFEGLCQGLYKAFPKSE